MQIPFHKTHTTHEEFNTAIEAIKSGWLTMGLKTVEFENKLAAESYNDKYSLKSESS